MFNLASICKIDLKQEEHSAGQHSADSWNMLSGEALGVESRVCHENEEGIYSYIGNECGEGKSEAVLWDYKPEGLLVALTQVATLVEVGQFGPDTLSSWGNDAREIIEGRVMLEKTWGMENDWRDEQSQRLSGKGVFPSSLPFQRTG